MNDPEIESTDGERNEFEQHLMVLLRRTDAPEGFLERVLERAAATERAAPARWPHFRGGMSARAWAGAMIAILALGGFVANQVHVWRERARVQDEFETAMRITADALHQTRTELERTGLKLGD